MAQKALHNLVPIIPLNFIFYHSILCCASAKCLKDFAFALLSIQNALAPNVYRVYSLISLRSLLQCHLIRLPLRILFNIGNLYPSTLYIFKYFSPQNLPLLAILDILTICLLSFSHQDERVTLNSIQYTVGSQ